MYVYILKSRVIAEKYYVGITDNLETRLKEHNSGDTFSTRDHGLWKIINHFWFENIDKASRFEKYLKTGSGREWSRRHLR
jgi:predicted GIY-YIG superfamily endonuclease